MKLSIKIRPDIIAKLEALTHGPIGDMADNLKTQPQTVRHHIKKRTPTLIRMDYHDEIKRVLNIPPGEKITE